MRQYQIHFKYPLELLLTFSSISVSFGMHELFQKENAQLESLNKMSLTSQLQSKLVKPPLTLQRPFFFLFWWTFHTIIINLTALQRPSLALQESRSTSSLRNTSEDFGYP